jgi:type IV pilus assembly protein PilF
MRLYALALLAMLCAGCVSQTTTELRTSDQPGAVDVKRRAQVHVALASEYYQRGNYSIALEETRLAIKDDSTLVTAYNMQGLIYMELRDDGPARAAFEQALRIAPNDGDSMNNYGFFLCLRGEGDRGMEYLRRVQTNSLYTAPEKPLLNAGLCERIRGRFDEAIDYLGRAVLYNPNLLVALYNLADMHFQRGALREAQSYYQRYSKLADPTATALALGVRIARGMGDTASEESLMQQMRRRYPDSPQTREILDKRS